MKSLKNLQFVFYLLLFGIQNSFGQCTNITVDVGGEDITGQHATAHDLCESTTYTLTLGGSALGAGRLISYNAL